MPRTKRELLAYAVKMRERGETYRTVHKYLTKASDDEALRKEVIRELDALEARGGLKTQPEKPQGGLDLGVILSVVLMGGGAALVVHLWGRGLVSTVPFIIMGAGLLGLSKSIK